MSFLVTALVALAAVGTVLGAAFYLGFISTRRRRRDCKPDAARQLQLRPGHGHAQSAAPSASPSPTAGSILRSGIQPGRHIHGSARRRPQPDRREGRHPVAAHRRGQQHPPGPTTRSRPGDVLIIPVLPQPSDGSRLLHRGIGRQHHEDRDKFGIDPRPSPTTTTSSTGTRSRSARSSRSRRTTTPRRCPPGARPNQRQVRTAAPDARRATSRRPPVRHVSSFDTLTLVRARSAHDLSRPDMFASLISVAFARRVSRIGRPRGPRVKLSTGWTSGGHGRNRVGSRKTPVVSRLLRLEAT